MYFQVNPTKWKSRYHEALLTKQNSEVMSREKLFSTSGIKTTHVALLCTQLSRFLIKTSTDLQPWMVEVPRTQQFHISGKVP